MENNINLITMSLEDYTKLIKENFELNAILQSLKKKAKNDVEELVREQPINALNKEECIKILNEKNETYILSHFSTGYSWKYQSIAESCYIVKEKDIKQLLVDTIINSIKSHLDDLLYEENKNENRE